MLCRERVSAAVAGAADKEAGKKAESEERLKVFNEICSNGVAADILTRYVHDVVKVSQSIRFGAACRFVLCLRIIDIHTACNRQITR